MATSSNEDRPPDLTARARAYGDGPMPVIRNGRPAPTPAPSPVDQLATLVELVTALRGDVAALRERVDAMAPRVAAAESSADMAYDEALAARKAIDDEVGPRVLGPFEHLYDLYSAIEDHDAGARPDPAIINLTHNIDNEEN